MVIFGAGGDLTKRLLIPSLYNLSVNRSLPSDFRILAIDQRDFDTQGWVASLVSAIEDFSKDPDAEFSVDHLDETAWGRLLRNARYQTGDFTTDALFSELKDALGNGNVIFYLAVAARFFAPVVEGLGKAGLLRQGEGFFRRVVIEKPFGHDVESARVLNAAILKQGDESQFYRIDHFLGKETVQSIMAVRFANGMFEPSWRREYIDHVQITASETVGVENRGRFYEGTGALRDMVPNHLFTLLCMIAMEPPNSLDAEAVRQEKTKLLEAVRTLGPKDYVRGQYEAGRIAARDIAAYRTEPDVAPDSRTETYIAMKLMIDNWRWGGVPFYVRTGKRLAARQTEIAIVFKAAPYTIFRELGADRPAPNVVRLLIDPVHGIRTEFEAKRPGPEVTLAPVHSTFLYRDFFGEAPNVGYETLLYDCMIGDPMLFQRADAIEAAWRIVQPVFDRAGDEPVPYRAGTQGPDAADELLERDGRAWVSVGGVQP